MSWREKIVIRVLLLVARMVAGDPWAAEIDKLATHIVYGKPDEVKP